MIHPSDTMRQEARGFWELSRFMRFNMHRGIPFERIELADEFAALADITDWPLMRERYCEARASLLRLPLAYQA